VLVAFGTFVVMVVLLVAVAFPLLTLIHEFGHALVAAVLIGGSVVVVQGPSPPRVRFSLVRLDVRLRGPSSVRGSTVGWTVWGPHPDTWRHVAATAAGPLTSLVCLAAAVEGAAALHGAPSQFLRLVMVAEAVSVVFTVLPVRYGRLFGAYAGHASDGLRIRQLLRGTPEPAPTV
jgi:hypothetical protein